MVMSLQASIPSSKGVQAVSTLFQFDAKFLPCMPAAIVKLVTGRLLAEVDIAPSADRAPKIRFDSKLLCVYVRLLYTDAKFIAIWTICWAALFSPNGLLACFDQCKRSKWDRMNLTPPKPAQTLGIMLTL